MDHPIQVIVHEPGDFHSARWRNSAIDEYIKRGDPEGRSECSSALLPIAVYGDSRRTHSYAKREPVFGSLSPRKTRNLVHP